MPASTKSASRPGFVRRLDRYCEICDRDFSRPAEYKRHIENTLIHNPLHARKFDCSYCGDLFNNPANRRLHESNHIVVQPDRMCGLPLGNGRTGLCNYSCTDPDSMVRHMRRVHLEAYNRTQGNLPGWIETEKRKKRKSTQAKRAESKQQAAEAERKSKCKATSQAKSKSKRKATPTPDVQVFRFDTMELIGSEDVGAETPVFELSELGSSTFSFSSDVSSTASTSHGRSGLYDAAPLPLDDYEQFPRFPSANFSVPMPVPRYLTDEFGPIIFDDLISWGRPSSGEFNMFNDVASNSFPQLPDSQFLFGNSAADEWSQDLHFGATGNSRQQADLNFFDYSQFTSPVDTFTAFCSGL